MGQINVLYLGENEGLGQMKIGVATCPVCKRENVPVVNGGAYGGKRAHDYFSSHGPTGELCPASQKYLCDVVKGDLRELCLPLD